MLKHFTLLGIFGLLIGLNSCETEFSLNGDYQITPVVFGLLDESDSVHLIKITKAFLGDGNNLVYAKNPDSNYFAQVDARITEYNFEGDATGRVWQLKDTIIENKSTDGVFYSPEQKVYYFTANDLVSDYAYQLDADFNEGQASITAFTGLIKNFSAPSKYDPGIQKLSFAINNVDEDKDYKVVRADFTPGTNVGLFQYGYTFNWEEHYESGEVKTFSLYRNIGTEDDLSSAPLYSGIEFYRWIQESIPDDPEVVTRKVIGFDMHISVAHSTFAQYLSVSQPVSGIAQVQPVFTNIEGGYGLFSSRKQYIKKDLQLDAPSTKELANGQFTITKRFCSSYPAHSDESYYCEE
ncbi:DUF4249 family protein [Crocinitomix algicola]|uniref:DUF4249 family protein n=1 Tax=Crocinitomix algicola TaxID=1740263 RepID=UPI000872C02C|nr:DUF4249 family protein [Crocinitomix algicola]